MSGLHRRIRPSAYATGAVRRARRRWWAAPGAVLIAGLGACDALTTDVVCAGPGQHSVVAEVRDDRGRPAANGATLTIRQPNYVAAGRGFGEDALTVSAGSDRTGEFLATVTKPWHERAVVENVTPPTDECGLEAPARIEVTLPRVPDAPAVRQVVVPFFDVLLGDGNVTTELRAIVEADSTVSREASWFSRDTSVARITETGTVTSACRSSPDSTHVVAFAVAEPAVRDSVEIHVGAADPSSGRCP